MQMAPEDLEVLQAAKRLLESTSLAMKLANVAGKPIEKGIQLLPAKISAVVNDVTRKSLEVALNGALLTLDKSTPASSSNWWHKSVVTLAGAVGGAFGLAALPIELPITTALMLRSIADIARSEGEDLHAAEAKLACIEVFALGSPSHNDDALESGYYAVRGVLATGMREAAERIARQGLREGGPAIVRFISQIASRFGIAIGEKEALQAIPLIGAIGGATINLVFIDHFQDVSKGHFAVRRLERTYGSEVVRAEYSAVRD